MRSMDAVWQFGGGSNDKYSREKGEGNFFDIFYKNY